MSNLKENFDIADSTEEISIEQNKNEFNDPEKIYKIKKIQ